MQASCAMFRLSPLLISFTFENVVLLLQKQILLARNENQQSVVDEAVKCGDKELVTYCLKRGEYEVHCTLYIRPNCDLTATWLRFWFWKCWKSCGWGIHMLWVLSLVSYLSQIVCINGCRSVALSLSYCVPHSTQGSVGGPILSFNSFDWCDKLCYNMA